MDWQNSRPVIVSSRGAGTGLFAQPSHHTQTNDALTNRPMSRAEANAEAAAAREEVISMKIEHTAQASLVEMLTQRCARLGSQLERQRLDAKIMATKLKESEDHRKRLLQSTEATGMRGSQLEEQVEILREELDTARRVDKEKEESLLMLSKALREAQAESREQTAQSNQDASEAEKFAEAERRRNAGLMQQLQQEQKRVVDMASRIRNLETQLQEKELEMSACLADVEAEKEWRERAQAERKVAEEQRAKLQERVATLLGHLDAERVQAQTARERAESMAADAKRARQRAQEEAEVLNEKDLRLKQAQGHVAMKDRRVQLLKKQLHQEKTMRIAAEKKRDELARINERLREKMPGTQKSSVSDSLESLDEVNLKLSAEECKRLGPNVQFTAPVAPETRKEKLQSIRKIMDDLPDPSRMAGSDAPEWVRS